MSLISRNRFTKELLGKFSFESSQSIFNKLSSLRHKKEITKKLDTKHKQDALNTFSTQLIKNKSDLAQIISVETGKSEAVCESEIRLSIRYIDSVAKNADSLLKSTRSSSDNFKNVSLRPD